jgi:hypothetical protein
MAAMTLRVLLLKPPNFLKFPKAYINVRRNGKEESNNGGEDFRNFKLVEAALSWSNHGASLFVEITVCSGKGKKSILGSLVGSEGK